MRELILALLFPMLAFAQMKHLDDLVAKATPQEQKNMKKLLHQIQLVPIKNPETGVIAMQVTRVDKGSVFDREGVQVGDFLWVANPPDGPTEKSADKKEKKLQN